MKRAPLRGVVANAIALAQGPRPSEARPCEAPKAPSSPCILLFLYKNFSKNSDSLDLHAGRPARPAAGCRLQVRLMQYPSANLTPIRALSIANLCLFLSSFLC